MTMMMIKFISRVIRHDIDTGHKLKERGIHVFGSIYKVYMPYKEKPWTYFWLRSELNDDLKYWYRVTDYFFIESKKGWK